MVTIALVTAMILGYVWGSVEFWMLLNQGKLLGNTTRLWHEARKDLNDSRAGAEMAVRDWKQANADARKAEAEVRTIRTKIEAIRAVVDREIPPPSTRTTA